MGGFEYLSPFDIRFTQDSIGNRFQDGGSVNQLIEDIDRGIVQVNEIQPIRVCKQNNKYYSIDNRRLYVFRVLQKRKFLQTIKVKIWSHIDEEKLTTGNDGASIRVRRDTTHPHTSESRTQKKRGHSYANSYAPGHVRRQVDPDSLLVIANPIAQDIQRMPTQEVLGTRKIAHDIERQTSQNVYRSQRDLGSFDRNRRYEDEESCCGCCCC